MARTLKQIRENIHAAEEAQASICEAVMRDIQKHNVGDTVHPYIQHTWNVSHMAPHVVTKKLDSKTELQNTENGRKFSVSHANGKVKDSDGIEQKYSFHGFHTPAEKGEIDEKRRVQNEKNNAHDTIVNKLAGMKNGHGHTVGALSDDEHAELLRHLDTLREKK